MPRKLSSRKSVRLNKKKGGAFLSSDQYATAVYGAQHQAIADNNNTIAMKQVVGGTLLPLSPATLADAGADLSQQGASVVTAATASSATQMVGGAPSNVDKDNNIHLGGSVKKGGRVGLEQIIVPAGLMVANQWMRKSRKQNRSNRRRSSKSRR